MWFVAASVLAAFSNFGQTLGCLPAGIPPPEFGFRGVLGHYKLEFGVRVKPRGISAYDSRGPMASMGPMPPGSPWRRDS